MPRKVNIQATSTSYQPTPVIHFRGRDATDRQPVILIVDDLAQNARLLESVLVPRGYRVVIAGSGAEALARVTDDPPDLVLLDILMPGIDGYEVCRRLRDQPATAVLPVVMITASGGQEKLRALEAGADDFISKPFDRAELLAGIRSLVRIKQFQDTITAQAAALASWSEQLNLRVTERTRELEEARAEVLALYRELARRNHEMHDMLTRLIQQPGMTQPRDQTGAGEAPVERLTPREREVLRHVARGQTNAEIAAALVVSAGTIKFHLEHIIAKLGVADRTQAAVRAVELGLLAT